MVFFQAIDFIGVICIINNLPNWLKVVEYYCELCYNMVADTANECI
ncbi:MAG: hypothetical protein PHV07_06890 [Oscillospiraceae bacterium]|nr:hypothetical protein [Oscillospiraceae bacterium]